MLTTTVPWLLALAALLAVSAGSHLRYQSAIAAVPPDKALTLEIMHEPQKAAFAPLVVMVAAELLRLRFVPTEEGIRLLMPALGWLAGITTWLTRRAVSSTLEGCGDPLYEALAGRLRGLRRLSLASSTLLWTGLLLWRWAGPPGALLR